MTRLIALAAMTLLLSNVDGMDKVQNTHRQKGHVLRQQLLLWNCHGSNQQQQNKERQRFLNEQKQLQQLHRNGNPACSHGSCKIKNQRSQLCDVKLSLCKIGSERTEQRHISRFYEYFVPTKYNP
jgi:hypothetical protein